MYTSMTCQCGAHFEVDTEDSEDSCLLMMYRFSNAHAKHGYMSAPNTDTVTLSDLSGRQSEGFTAE